MALRKIVVRFPGGSPAPDQIQADLQRRTGLAATVNVPEGGSGTVIAPPCRAVDIGITEDAVAIYSDPGPLRYLEQALLSCLVGMGGDYSGKAVPPGDIRPWTSLRWRERRRS